MSAIYYSLSNQNPYSQRNQNYSVSSSAIDIEGFERSIEDARSASMRQIRNLAIPNGYDELMNRLQEQALLLPKIYQETVAYPLIDHLNTRSNNGEKNIDLSAIEIDAIRAIFFHTGDCFHEATEQQDIKYINSKEHAYCKASRAAQEMVSDLYDGFLAYEKNANVSLPEGHTVAPLQTWGTDGLGPYTWPIDASDSIGLKTALVSLPLQNALGGLLAWTTLAHEVSGHDLLHADVGLLKELEGIVSNALLRNLSPIQTLKGRVSYAEHLAHYWSIRIDETASDVLGLLNLGPAAGMGLIGYFRAISANGKLRSNSTFYDSHPSDILRGFLAAEAVNSLPFSKNHEWSQIILQETLKDYPLKSRVSRLEKSQYGDISLDGVSVPFEVARQSARIVAQAIMNTPLKCLKDTNCQKKLSIAQIRSWGTEDETHVAKIRAILKGYEPIKSAYPSSDPSGYYAENVVAAATIEALTRNSDIPHIFNRMLQMLETMNRFNPSWKETPAISQCEQPLPSYQEEDDWPAYLLKHYV